MHKILLISFAAFAFACSGGSDNTTTEKTDSIKTDTTRVVAPATDHTGTYEYVNPYNSLDLIHNHYIVLHKNSDDTYSGRYYGVTDLFDADRTEYAAGFFVLPMQNIVIEGENLNFELIPAQEDFFNEVIDLSMMSSGDAKAAGFTAWEVYTQWDPKKFEAKIQGGSITLLNQVEEMTFIPMN